MDRLYFDNAASTPLYPEVAEAMLPYLLEHYGNPSSIHHHGRQLRAAIEGARKTVADALGCSPAEIVFTSGGTEADNMVLKGAAVGLGIRHIITSRLEHHAVGHSVDYLAAHHNVRVSYLEPDSVGNLSLTDLEALLKASQVWQEPTLVSLMHGNNEIGTLLPLEAVGELCAQYGARFHSDSVQTVGHLPLDTRRLKVDYLVGSAHKFHGPKGVGFLYVRAGAAVPSLICGGGQERNQRAGTENVAAIVGLAAALKQSVDHLESHLAHLQDLKAYAVARLSAAIDGVAFNGPTDARTSLPTVLNVAFPGREPESLILFNLDLHGVSASGGSACTSGATQGSHVLQALGLAPERVANSVRISFGSQNTRADIDALLERLARFMPLRLAAATA